MATHLIDFHQAQKPSSDDLPGLYARLAQLIGEPFRFARVSYGDELTLHFGDLRPSRSPKLKDKLYGAYILGMRASAWLLKSGSEPVIVEAGVLLDPISSGLGKPLSKDDLESQTWIKPGSLVLSATPFVVKPLGSFGLQLRLSDGSTIAILPTIQEPNQPEEEGLPELADWDLTSPQGLLNAGPGLEWSFEPSVP